MLNTLAKEGVERLVETVRKDMPGHNILYPVFGDDAGEAVHVVGAEILRVIGEEDGLPVQGDQMQASKQYGDASVSAGFEGTSDNGHSYVRIELPEKNGIYSKFEAKFKDGRVVGVSREGKGVQPENEPRFDQDEAMYWLEVVRELANG